MRFILNFYTIVIFIFLSDQALAQAATYIDPAQAFNKLLIEKKSGTYQQVGNFKVIGTSYLFGDSHEGDVFTSDGSALNIKTRYNTYSQKIEIIKSGENKFLSKGLEEVDSFMLMGNVNSNLHKNLYFVNSKYIDPSEKVFLNLIESGKNYNLYKAYKSTLGFVSTNYVQPELRQFDLDYQYYYQDNLSNKLKKLRPDYGFVSKKFKNRVDISSILSRNEFNLDPELGLIKIISYLNK